MSDYTSIKTIPESKKLRVYCYQGDTSSLRVWIATVPDEVEKLQADTVLTIKDFTGHTETARANQLSFG